MSWRSSRYARLGKSGLMQRAQRFAKAVMLSQPRRNLAFGPHTGLKQTVIMEENSEAKEVEYLQRVVKELGRYEHPLFKWEACSVPSGIQVTVSLKQEVSDVGTYRFVLKPRELEARAFQWDFQRMLYNYLHDYLVEMFTRSPQITDLTVT